MKILNLFKGLTKEYYFRQIFFGVLVAILYIFMILEVEGSNLKYPIILMAIINTILYPYSRFAYETIMSFILGNTFFIHNILFFITWKAFTIVMCWALALFIAPIGLIFIYFYQKKDTNND